MAKDNDVAVIGAIAVSFGCPYQGDVPEEDVFKIVKEYLERGAATIILADTTGMGTPHRVDRLVREFQSAFPDTDYVLHFHNNRGTAMANLFAAILAGATSFDTSLGGIGGCPYVPQAAGNLPTEDVVYMRLRTWVSVPVSIWRASSGLPSFSRRSSDIRSRVRS